MRVEVEQHLIWNLKNVGTWKEIHFEVLGYSELEQPTLPSINVDKVFSV